jgi:diguanylate cyclase (GGDEF)-like protein
VAARGHRLGTVTLVRPESAPFDAHGVDLLCLLVDQMAVAVQNARDYRERLEQAIRDPLTGLYNRRFLLEALDKEVQRVERYGSEASLVIFDVDDFKLVNDSLGHAAGDEVLRGIGELALQAIRPTDSFARIGGEEFALLLPETGQLEALLVAERVRPRWRAARSSRPQVTISGGLASAPDDGMGAEELQRLADGALYWAKRNGKDRCAVASDVTTEPAPAAPEDMLRHLYALVALFEDRTTGSDRAEVVAGYAMALAQQLGLDARRVSRVRRAALAAPARQGRPLACGLRRGGRVGRRHRCAGPGRPGGDEHPCARDGVHPRRLDRGAALRGGLPARTPMCSTRSKPWWRRGASIGSVPAWLGRVMGRHADATELRPVRTGLRGGHAGRPAPARRAAPRGGAAVA